MDTNDVLVFGRLADGGVVYMGVVIGVGLKCTLKLSGRKIENGVKDVSM